MLISVFIAHRMYVINPSLFALTKVARTPGFVQYACIPGRLVDMPFLTMSCPSCCRSIVPTIFSLGDCICLPCTTYRQIILTTIREPDFALAKQISLAGEVPIAEYFTLANITCRYGEGKQDGFCDEAHMAFAWPGYVILHIYLVVSFHILRRSLMPTIVLLYSDYHSLVRQP